MGRTPTDSASESLQSRDAVTVVVNDPDAEEARPSRVPQGASIGRYVVLEEIGSGGMGRVLRAYDPKLQREVALKDAGARVLLLSSSKRLVAEARAMAKLSHANVVTVYDVEEVPSDEGRRWTLGPVVLVMEYVAGRTLQAWLTERPRTWREIVARFLEAGRGLAAAHAAGLLHRDFKPSNVLVGEDDVVKVTDFGLAKIDVTATGELPADLGHDTVDDPDPLPTQTGIVLGSPRYMAPEQHQKRALTVAADQYAFCVALWEALLGEAPYPARGLADLLRTKLQGPPPFPRAVVPRRIADAIRRGLAPAPEDRWPSMHALLEAISFDPDKRRRRVVLGAASLGAIAIVAVAVQVRTDASACTGAADELRDVWDDARRSEVQAGMLATAAPFAEHVWTWTSAALDGYAASWQTAYADACEASAIRKEQSTEVLDLRMACLHRAKLELQAVTNALAQADAKTVEQAHVAVGGLPLVSRCADVEALRAEVEPPRPEHVEAVEAARVQLAAARVANAAGRLDQAEQELAEAEDVLVGVDYDPIRTDLALVRGSVLESRADFDQAEAVVKGALENALADRAWDSTFRATMLLMHVVGYRQRRPDEAMGYRELASALSRDDPMREAAYRKALGLLYLQQGAFPAAEVEVRRALAIWTEQRGPDDMQVAIARNHLAGVLHELGRREESEDEYRRVLVMREEALGPSHPLTITSRANLALLIHKNGRSAEAEAEQRRALAAFEALYGPEHLEVGTAWGNLALMLDGQKKFDEALAAERRGAEVIEKALGPDHPQAIEASWGLATSYLARDQLEAAEAEFRRVLPRMEARYGPDDRLLAMMRGNLAITLDRLGRLEEAELECRRSIAVLEVQLGPEHQDVAIGWFNHGSNLRDLGRNEEAEARFRQAMTAWDRNEETRDNAAMARTSVAEIMLDDGRAREALALAEDAWARLKGTENHSERGRAAFALARALRATGDKGRARELGLAAQEAYALAKETNDSLTVWLRSP